MNYQVGDIANLPLIESEARERKVTSLVDDSVLISKTDWDSFEISWDFKRHPLI